MGWDSIYTEPEGMHCIDKEAYSKGWA
jgi:hypothetical protein